jgi:hypothetical protein
MMWESLRGELVGAVDGGAGDDRDMSLMLDSAFLSSLAVSGILGGGDSGVVASCAAPTVVSFGVMAGELSDSSSRWGVTGDGSGAAAGLGAGLD